MKIIHLDEVNSTNKHAAELVKAGEIKSPTVIYTDIQTAGMGSRGRHWESRIGNVMASYVLPLHDLDRPTQWLVHCCALATRETLLDLGVDDDIQVKWPNDILINNRKVSGSLHVSGYHGTQAFLIAGIGINAVWHPDPSTALFPPTSLSDVIQSVPEHHFIVRSLFGHILNRFENYRENGYAEIREEYTKHLWRLDEMLGVSLDKEKNTKFEGLNRGVADDGSLMLEMSGTIKHVHVGDVFEID